MLQNALRKRLNDYILQPYSCIQSSANAKQYLSSPMTRNNTTPSVTITIDNNPYTGIIFSTARRASILR